MASMLPRQFCLSALFLASLCGCASSERQLHTYSIGEGVQLGPLVYTVFESQWLTQLGAGPSARIPRQRFLLLRLSVGNHGPSERVAPILTVADEEGRTYTELSDGNGVPQWIGLLRGVKPGQALQGMVAFDAPPRRYKLRITGESEERAALIDIPLTFAPEAPEIPVPEKK